MSIEESFSGEGGGAYLTVNINLDDGFSNAGCSDCFHVLSVALTQQSIIKDYRFTSPDKINYTHILLESF